MQADAGRSAQSAVEPFGVLAESTANLQPEFSHRLNCDLRTPAYGHPEPRFEASIILDKCNEITNPRVK